MKKQIRNVLVLALAVLATGVSTVQAATTPSVTNVNNNGLKVSPVRLDQVIQPGTSRTVDVVVQNVTPTPATLRGIVNDFVANSNETGQPDIILDEDKFAATHSLKRLVGPLPTVTLQPNEQKIVKVTITVPESTPAGGYYGTVRFVSARAEKDDNGVLLLPSVGTLILLRVPGDLRESLNVASLDIRHEDTAHKLFTSPDDLKAVIRFRNEGNVQVEPFGKVTLRDHRGKVISDTEINNTDPRGSVLPDSVRRFDVALNDLGKLGKYTVEGNFGYGTTGQLITAKTTFYVVPLPLIILAGVIVLFIILAIIFVPKAVRAYNRRILRNARYRK